MRDRADRRDPAAADDASHGDRDGAQHAPIRVRTARRLLLIALAVSAVLSIAAWALLAHQYATYPGTRTYGYWREGALSFTIFVSVGAILAVRRPTHPIAWTFGAINLVGSVQQFLGTYGDYALFARPDELPGGLVAAVVSSAAQAAFVGTLILLVALFPTGRALSPRWRVVTLAALGLAQTDGHLTFEVADDGAGFDPATASKGHGTTNTTDRLAAHGGTLHVDSAVGGGTTVRGRLPVEPDPPGNRPQEEQVP